MGSPPQSQNAQVFDRLIGLCGPLVYELRRTEWSQLPSEDYNDAVLRKTQCYVEAVTPEKYSKLNACLSKRKSSSACKAEIDSAQKGYYAWWKQIDKSIASSKHLQQVAVIGDRCGGLFADFSATSKEKGEQSEEAVNKGAELFRCMGMGMEPKLFEKLEQCQVNLGKDHKDCQKILHQLDGNIKEVRAKALEALGWSREEVEKEDVPAKMAAISDIIHGLNDFK